MSESLGDGEPTSSRLGRGSLRFIARSSNLWRPDFGSRRCRRPSCWHQSQSSGGQSGPEPWAERCAADRAGGAAPTDGASSMSTKRASMGRLDGLRIWSMVKITASTPLWSLRSPDSVDVVQRDDREGSLMFGPGEGISAPDGGRNQRETNWVQPRNFF